MGGSVRPNFSPLSDIVRVQLYVCNVWICLENSYKGDHHHRTPRAGHPPKAWEIIIQEIEDMLLYAKSFEAVFRKYKFKESNFQDTEIERT